MSVWKNLLTSFANIPHLSRKNRHKSLSIESFLMNLCEKGVIVGNYLNEDRFIRINQWSKFYTDDMWPFSWSHKPQIVAACVINPMTMWSTLSFWLIVYEIEIEKVTCKASRELRIAFNRIRPHFCGWY